MQDTSFSWFNFLGTKFRNAALRQSECELGGWDKFIFLFWCWIQSLNLTKALPTPQFMATMAREDLSAPVSFYCISTTRKHLPPNNLWVGGKDPDAGKNWRWEKGMAEDEMVGWYHHLYGLEFMWSPGVGDGQGRLVCSSPWGRKESDTTERLNLTECYWCCLGNHGEFRMTWT